MEGGVSYTVLWEAAKILISTGVSLIFFYFKFWASWKKEVDRCLAKLSEEIAVINSELKNIKGFHELLMQKMVALMIHPDTPDVDRLLIRIARGEDLNDEELVFLHDRVQHLFEEAIRGHHDKDQYALAFILTWIEQKRKKGS